MTGSDNPLDIVVALVVGFVLGWTFGTVWGWIEEHDRLRWMR